MRLTADNQYRWQDTLLEAVRIGGALAGLVLLSACSMNGTSQASYVVPAEAIQRRAQDPFVFLIKPDSTVESRPVVVRRMLENLAVVDQGLAAGDLVVAEAPLDLIPGTRVTVRETGFSGAE